MFPFVLYPETVLRLSRYKVGVEMKINQTTLLQLGFPDAEP